MEKIGFYSGSFNPFTRGHMQVIVGAMRQLDRIIIGIGVNTDKPETSPNINAILSSIEDFYTAYKYRDIIGEHLSTDDIAFLERYEKDKSIVQVISYTGTTIDAAWHAGCKYLVRGVRASGTDTSYEDNLGAMNNLLSQIRNYDLQTMIVATDEKYSMLSSSNARGLAKIGEFEALKTICFPSVVEQMASDYLQAKHLEPMPSDGYHNNTHVACMINWLNAAGAENMDFAASVHDAEPLPKLVQQYPKYANLILATDHTGECTQKCTWDNNACLFHDADLAILFSQNYGWYAYQVFCEYKDKCSVSEYAKGRIQVLKTLLNKNYKTDYFKRFQPDKEKNINWEISYWNNILKKG